MHEIEVEHLTKDYGHGSIVSEFDPKKISRYRKGCKLYGFLFYWNKTLLHRDTNERKCIEIVK